MASETIEDIVAEMRYGAIPKHQTDHELLALYADRIEAAAKRMEQTYLDQIRDAINQWGHEKYKAEHASVGNAAAMREALEFIKLASDDYETYGNTKAGALDVIYEKACAALAAPPRNCDRYSHDEALSVWAAEKENGKNGCFDEWLYAPATEQKGECDGSK